MIKLLLGFGLGSLGILGMETLMWFTLFFNLK